MHRCCRPVLAGGIFLLRGIRVAQSQPRDAVIDQLAADDEQQYVHELKKEAVGDSMVEVMADFDADRRER